MELTIREELPRAEIVHHADGDLLVTSRAGAIRVARGADLRDVRHVRLPTPALKRPFNWLRLTRRALRLDKCNVVPTADGGLIVVYQHRVWRAEPDGTLRQTLPLRLCRNVLHQSINRTPSGAWFFGEYGGNPDRRPVPVYRSDDEGRSWREVFTFPAGKIKHVHGCYWDPVEERVWVCTGDFAGENYLLVADEDFSDVEWLGDGTQTWRTCNLFFGADHVTWLMDSQLEDSHVVRLDRATRTAERGQRLPGPVWYVKQLADGPAIAATASEIGPGVHDDFAHVFASTDLVDWREVARFPHDGLPRRWFKFGVIGFADGPQTADDFYLFGEALVGLDGRAMRCALTP